MVIDDKYLHSNITHSILQAFYTVCRQLPYGLPPATYKNALTIELTKLGLQSRTDKEVIIRYDQQVIGTLPIDLIVNDSVIVTILSTDNIIASHQTAIKNQLRLGGYEVGLILNFGLEGQHKRFVHTNDIKKN